MSEFQEMPVVAWVIDEQKKARILLDFLRERHPHSTIIMTAADAEHNSSKWYKLRLPADDVTFEDYSLVSGDSDCFLAGYNARLSQEMEEKYED